MVEKVFSFNKELLSLCFRFVDSEQNIRDDFFFWILYTQRELIDYLLLRKLQTGTEKSMDIANGGDQVYGGAASKCFKSVGLLCTDSL